MDVLMGISIPPACRICSSEHDPLPRAGRCDDFGCFERRTYDPLARPRRDPSNASIRVFTLPVVLGPGTDVSCRGKFMVGTGNCLAAPL